MNFATCEISLDRKIHGGHQCNACRERCREGGYRGSPRVCERVLVMRESAARGIIQIAACSIDRLTV